MAYRINVMFDAPTWGLLKKIAPGERSQVVCQALRDWFDQKKRERAAKKMDALRGRFAPISQNALLGVLRTDRGRR